MHDRWPCRLQELVKLLSSEAGGRAIEVHLRNYGTELGQFLAEGLNERLKVHTVANAEPVAQQIGGQLADILLGPAKTDIGTRRRVVEHENVRLVHISGKQPSSLGAIGGQRRRHVGTPRPRPVEGA